MQSENLYDIVKRNFKKLGRKTYVHCYFYIGSHKMKHQRLGTFMRKVIELGWKEYQDEHLTGFLIFYSDVYIHILEGSDYALERHMTLLSKTTLYQNKMSDLRFLYNYYHIRNRNFKSWDCLLCEPPKLSEKILPATNDEEGILHLAFDCLKKINQLAKYIASGKNTEPFKSIEKRISMEESEEVAKYTEILPEQEVIAYLTKCDLLNGADEILGQEKRIYKTQDEIETVWPLPDVDIPYHILSKPKPPPFEDKKKKTKKDDEPEFNEEEEKERKKLDKKLLEYLRVLKEKVEKERLARKKQGERKANAKFVGNEQNATDVKVEKGEQPKTTEQTQEKQK